MRTLVLISVLAIVVALLVPATSAGNGKGLAVTPITDKKSPAVIATRTVNQYFKNALGSSTMLTGKKATRGALMNQLQYNRKLIAWNFIGDGTYKTLLMYDGNITINDFYYMKKWEGLKDCVCFIGSNGSYEHPIRNYTIGGRGYGNDHKVRTYVGCVQPAVPIVKHAMVSQDFWRHTLFECYNMSDAINESANDTGVPGYYAIWGDTGRFFPPLNIQISVNPSSCAVRSGKPMTITAKSDRYVSRGTEVKLEVYRADDKDENDLLYTKEWTIPKKTKLLFRYTWYQSLLPDVYKIKVSVPKCGGTSYRYFAIVPGNGKFTFSGIDIQETVTNCTGSASGWIRPKKCYTIEDCNSGKQIGVCTATHYVKIVYTNTKGKTARITYKGIGFIELTENNFSSFKGYGSNHNVTVSKGSSYALTINDYKRFEKWM